MNTRPGTDPRCAARPAEAEHNRMLHERHRSANEFQWGTCTVPDGEFGPWKIRTTTLTKSDVMLANLRAIRDGNHYLICNPGTYRILTHSERGVIMSNTQMERRTSIEARAFAKGRVLINGLGMGMVLEGLLALDRVTSIRVVEIDADIISHVGSYFKSTDPRVEIVHGDAYEYKPSKGERYDYVWHDIWNEISASNLPKMGQLLRKWSKRAGKQGCWSRTEAMRERRRNG